MSTKTIIHTFFQKQSPDLPVEVKKISFCLSTNSKRTEISKKAILSIQKSVSKSTMEYEIIVCGVVHEFTDVAGVKLVEASHEAETGMLAKVRNIAAENAVGDVIVFLDDDILFEEKWASRLQEFSKANHWDVLGNRILLPDGGRYWDRAILKPHQMVPYDFSDADARLYQTGCLWIVRAVLFSKHKWDPTIEYYAERNGKINEDVEYSQRLIKAGYKLKFDEKNTVWHWDDTYQEVHLGPLSSVCIRREPSSAGIVENRMYSNAFYSILQSLT